MGPRCEVVDMSAFSLVVRDAETGAVLRHASKRSLIRYAVETTDLDYALARGRREFPRRMLVARLLRR
jgi:hypothetical protein